MSSLIEIISLRQTDSLAQQVVFYFSFKGYAFQYGLENRYLNKSNLMGRD